MKTAEEILSRKRLLIKDGVEWTPVNSAIQAMEEYAQQIELPSDKEIEQECIDRYIGNLAPTYFTEGAKWAVEWIKDKMK